MGFLLEQEDTKWRQRAKRSWYCLGDRNTKYFHICASQRKKKNYIKVVRDNSNSLKEDPMEIAAAFKQHFENVFSLSNPSEASIERCLGNIQGRVSESMNAQLLEKRLKRQ